MKWNSITLICHNVNYINHIETKIFEDKLIAMNFHGWVGVISKILVIVPRKERWHSNCGHNTYKDHEPNLQLVISMFLLRRSIAELHNKR